MNIKLTSIPNGAKALYRGLTVEQGESFEIADGVELEFEFLSKGLLQYQLEGGEFISGIRKDLVRRNIFECEIEQDSSRKDTFRILAKGVQIITDTQCKK